MLLPQELGRAKSGMKHPPVLWASGFRGFRVVGDGGEVLWRLSLGMIGISIRIHSPHSLPSTRE